MTSFPNFSSVFLTCLLLLSSEIQARSFDLSDWDGSSEFSLEGDWAFRQGHFQDPSTLVFEDIKSWKLSKIPHDAFGDHPSFNYGSFAAKLSGLKTKKSFVFLFPRVVSAAHYYLLYPNGSVIDLGGSGTPGESREQTKAEFYGHHKVINSEFSEVILLVHIAHKDLRASGFGTPIQLMGVDTWFNSRMQKNFAKFAMFGVLLAFLVYFFVLFWQRPKARENMWMGLVCLAFFFQHLAFSDLRFFGEAAHLDFDLRYRIRFLSGNGILYCVIAYLGSILPEYTGRMGRGLRYTALFIIGVVLITDISFYSPLNYINHIFILITIAYIVARLVNAIVEGELVASWVLLGFGVLISGGVHDILVANRLIPVREIMTPYSSIVFIISQSLLQGYYHAIAYRTIDDLSQSLQSQVDEQTLELKLKNQKLTDQVNETSSMLSVISHDVANHIYVINSSASMLFRKVDPKTDKMIRYFGKIEKGTENISDIIAHVRSLQSTRDGQKKLDLSPVNLQGVFHDLKSQFGEEFKKKNISLKIDLPDQQCWVLADEKSLSQVVLYNLVSNALKFSYEGGEICLRGHPNGRKVIVSVEDWGQGIPGTLVDDLFDITKPTSRSGTGGERGTGFGLPIVRAYLDKYGASIDIASRSEDDDPDHHGTIVDIRLLASEAPEPQASEEQEDPKTKAAS